MICVMTDDNFETLLEEHEIIFVDFWAEWCAPCKVFAEVFEQASQQYPEILFAKVDIESQQGLSDAFNIRSIPHLTVFKKGIAIYSESGTLPKTALLELIEQAKVVDVSKVGKS